MDNSDNEGIVNTSNQEQQPIPYDDRYLIAHMTNTNWYCIVEKATMHQVSGTFRRFTFLTKPGENDTEEIVGLLGMRSWEDPTYFVLTAPDNSEGEFIESNSGYQQIYYDPALGYFVGISAAHCYLLDEYGNSVNENGFFSLRRDGNKIYGVGGSRGDNVLIYEIPQQERPKRRFRLFGRKE